jgi:hypothetical protein
VVKIECGRKNPGRDAMNDRRQRRVAAARPAKQSGTAAAESHGGGSGSMGRKTAKKRHDPPSGGPTSSAQDGDNRAAPLAGAGQPAGEPSGAELAAAIYAAELEAEAKGAGLGRSVRARHMLATIGQIVLHVVALSLALSLAGLACVMFPPAELAGPWVPTSPLAQLPPLPVVQDVPLLASFLAGSFDDATEDLVKVLCLYATFSSGQLLATWVQFGVLPTEVHRARADPLWCTTAGSLTAALMYPRCNVIGDKAGDYAQVAQNYIREQCFGLPPKPPSRSRPIKYSNMYQYKPGQFGDKPAAVVIDDIIEDGFKGSCLLIHTEVGSLLGDALVLPLLPELLQVDEIVWATRCGKRIFASISCFKIEHVDHFTKTGSGQTYIGKFEEQGVFYRTLIMLSTVAGRYNDCDAYGARETSCIH